MQRTFRFGVRWSCATTLLLFLCGSRVLAQDVTNSSPANGTNEIVAEAQQTLRAYLQLQEQIHAASLAIEQNRQEATAAVQRNAELVSARLKLIEQAISLQREREADVLQKSNRTMLLTAASFGGVGLLAMLLTAFFLVRTMNRLTDISAAIPKGLGMGQTSLTGLGLACDSSVVTLPADSSRLLGAIERLEKRILELESGSSAPQLLPTTQETGTASGNGKHKEPVHAADSEILVAEVDPQERVSVILGKGQTLLNLGQSENALACFDEVLALEPANAEALVKKGTALERLRRWEEALQCYDRAIAANNEMTLAYLYKGGVFNQLERFSEALECYEQALRTQQKSAVPA